LPSDEAARRGRYIDGQALYERECEPLRLAHVVIDNDDLRRPEILHPSAGQPVE